MLNVNFEAMENKIEQILLKYGYNKITLEEAKQELLNLHSVMFKTDEFSIHRPQNNEPEVILIEDSFGHCREIDEPDFNNLMRVLHAVQDY